MLPVWEDGLRGVPLGSRLPVLCVSCKWYSHDFFLFVNAKIQIARDLDKFSTKNISRRHRDVLPRRCLPFSGAFRYRLLAPGLIASFLVRLIILRPRQLYALVAAPIFEVGRGRLSPGHKHIPSHPGFSW